VLEALQAALKEDGDKFLDADERAAVDAAARQLGEVRNGDDGRAIKRAIEALESASAVYVDRRMNANIQKAMAGHAVDEFK
jgi:molecular chaperone HscA